MPKIEITKTELVWPGKYNEDGTRREIPQVNLPFQIIETINESRATREANKAPKNLSLFDIYEGKEGDTFEQGWKNKLIWGDNLLVMGSLLEKFAGKIDLIYIDPPFATGADFSFSAQIGAGELETEKEQSLIEEKAYRDTWGRGLESYLTMVAERLELIRELLSHDGSLYVHMGPDIGPYAKVILDAIFGTESLRNEVVWRRTYAHNDPARYGNNCDYIYFYSKGDDWIWNQPYVAFSEEYIKSHYTKMDEKGRKYQLVTLDAPAHGRPPNYQWKGKWPPAGRMWSLSKEKMEELERKGLIEYTKQGMPRRRYYLDEQKGTPCQALWTDIFAVNSQALEDTGYDTQKPESLLERIVSSSSNPGSLVADFFCGSGTTMAVAEKFGRRWIGCDLSRWAVHVTRKRLLGIEKCKPFEVLNLGKYERKYWQGVTFGEGQKEKVKRQNGDQQWAIFQYIAFILKLYGAEPLSGMQHLHGKKGKAVVHIGAVDAPVTIDEINACIEECLAVKQSELHVLGWEWEMGLANLMVEEAKHRGVKLLLLNIPREVMEQQAVDKGDIRFFEVAHLEVEIKQDKGRRVTVALKDFAFPYADLIPEEVRSKIKKWSDYIDYWAVDWNFQNDTFMNGWVAYRTRKERKLPLTSDPYVYEKPGKYAIMVKAVDIFGNDTSQVFVVDVK